jgi:DNA-directed RNA polymerase specialized sigma24 family protein
MGPQIEILDESRSQLEQAPEEERLGGAGVATGSTDREPWLAQCENSLRYIAARMLRDASDVEEAVQNCFKRAESSRGPAENQKAFGRRLFRMIIDEAILIQRKRKTQAAAFADCLFRQ